MRRVLPTILAVLFLFGAFILSRAAGTGSDPLITLSFLNSKFSTAVGQRADTVWKPLADQYAGKIAGRKSETLKRISKAELADYIADRYIARIGGVRGGFTTRFTDFSLKKGDTVTGGAGTGLILRAGGAQISGGAGKTVVNVSAGAELKAGAAAPKGQYCLLLAADSSGFTVTSDTATVAVDGSYRITPAYAPQYNDLADALFAMKLFLGTPTGYNLARPATRLEGLVMMLRLFGEEEAALGCTDSCPFTDLPDWGRPYVAYAYGKGYTNGTSAAKFTPGASITPEQYMSFILRALGYSDAAGGDFVWNKSLDYAVWIGLFSSAEVSMIRNPFYRDQMVYLSYYALSGKVKGGGGTLLDRLIGGGAVSAAAAGEAMGKVTRVRP